MKNCLKIRSCFPKFVGILAGFNKALRKINRSLREIPAHSISFFA